MWFYVLFGRPPVTWNYTARTPLPSSPPRANRTHTAEQRWFVVFLFRRRCRRRHLFPTSFPSTLICVCFFSSLFLLKFLSWRIHAVNLNWWTSCAPVYWTKIQSRNNRLFLFSHSNEQKIISKWTLNCNFPCGRRGCEFDGWNDMPSVNHYSFLSAQLTFSWAHNFHYDESTERQVEKWKFNEIISSRINFLFESVDDGWVSKWKNAVSFSFTANFRLCQWHVVQ